MARNSGHYKRVGRWSERSGRCSICSRRNALIGKRCLFLTEKKRSERGSEMGLELGRRGRWEGSERASKQQEVAKSKGEGDREKREKEKGVQQKPT